MRQHWAMSTLGPPGGPVDAIVLAGGRATRMGGVDKPAIVVGDRRMLDTVLDAVADCARVAVVGPYRDELDRRVLQTQEAPVGGGPVAALAAGMARIGGPDDGVVVVLASDLPMLDRRIVADLVTRLVEDPEADASFAVDDAGRTQFLLGAWRKRALTAGLANLDHHRDQPMRALVPGRYTTLDVSGVHDCDTPDDLERARAAHVPGPMDLDEARARIRKSLTALAVRTVSPTAARGATLAAPLVAAEALPRFDVSAMDGYAVSGPGPWRLHTEIRYAGSATALVLTDGEAARIATGAQVPKGATAVVRDEFVEITDDAGAPLLRRRPGTPVRDDTRRRGDDWQPGHHLAEAGTTVTPAVVSAAASAEVTEVAVRGPVRAHLVLTGDEIRRGGPLRDGQTRDSIGPVLPDILRHCDVRAVSETHVRDTPGSFDALFRAGGDADVIVVVGATGGGAADQLRAALARAGARIIVGRVRCRPGGSQVTALLPDGRVVLGLPGNPLAAVATLLAVLPAVVDGLTGRVPSEPMWGAVRNAADAGMSVTRIVPVERQTNGTWSADTVVRTAHLAGLIGREALAVLPPDAVDDQTVELLSLPR